MAVPSIVSVVKIAAEVWLSSVDKEASVESVVAIVSVVVVSSVEKVVSVYSVEYVVPGWLEVTMGLLDSSVEIEAEVVGPVWSVVEEASVDSLVEYSSVVPV